MTLVRINNLILDSDQTTYHFKLENSGEFERWTGVFEKFSHELMRGIENGLNSIDEMAEYNAGGSDNVASFHGSTATIHSNFDSIQEKANIVANALQMEISKMKDLIDASKGRIDAKSQWKGTGKILIQTSLLF